MFDTISMDISPTNGTGSDCSRHFVPFFDLRGKFCLRLEPVLRIMELLISWRLAGYINVGCGGKAGYYFSSTCVLMGSLALFFIDLHRRNLARHKHTRANGTKHLCVSESCPQRKRLSFSQEPDNHLNQVRTVIESTAQDLAFLSFSPDTNNLTYLTRFGRMAWGLAVWAWWGPRRWSWAWVARTSVYPCLRQGMPSWPGLAAISRSSRASRRKASPTWTCPTTCWTTSITLVTASPHATR